MLKKSKPILTAWVNCVTVLQHVVDDGNFKRITSEIVRTVKNRGIIYILEICTEQNTIQTAPHVKRRSIEEFKKIFENNGCLLLHVLPIDIIRPPERYAHHPILKYLFYVITPLSYLINEVTKKIPSLSKYSQHRLLIFENEGERK